MRFATLLLFLAFTIISCEPSSTSADTAENTETTSKEVEVKKELTVTPFSPSKAFEDAKIEKMSYKNGKFEFTLNESSYELGVQTDDASSKMCANSAKGQHIHLIVNDAPYAAKYTNTFDYEIEDGIHHILAFLSRSYHESIKSAGAAVIQRVDIKNNTITEFEEVEMPMVFYSRPKGTYIGKANTDKVMLDFYVANAELGNGFKVKADINGKEHVLDKWQPYYIEGLPMGENTITLTLVNDEGVKIEAPLNPVTRTFTLKADPVEKATGK